MERRTLKLYARISIARDIANRHLFTDESVARLAVCLHRLHLAAIGDRSRFARNPFKLNCGKPHCCFDVRAFAAFNNATVVLLYNSG